MASSPCSLPRAPDFSCDFTEPKIFTSRSFYKVTTTTYQKKKKKKILKLRQQ